MYPFSAVVSEKKDKNNEATFPEFGFYTFPGRGKGGTFSLPDISLTGAAEDTGKGPWF
jgi:hypothetical protein